MTREESKKFNLEQERKMTGAERVRQTAMDILGFGHRSYQSLSNKEKDKVEKEVRQLVRDIEKNE